MKYDNVRLRMDPRQTPLSWSDFRRPYHIAIDGYVAEAPCFDYEMPCANFNHHEGVSRLATRATSAQVQLAIRMGLFKTFREKGEAKAIVCANDCDEDVCLTWFLLNNHLMAGSMIDPLLNRLVSVAELMDTTGGMLPLPTDSSILREMAWIFAPYRNFRINGGLDRRDATEFEGIVEQVHGRILNYMMGAGNAVRLDTTYKRIGGGEGWAMIEETGPYGRMGALADGISAFVAVRERPSGNWAYSVGRVSEFIRFPVEWILECLNHAEANALGVDYDKFLKKWGGSTTIGGSPREDGSVLMPSAVEAVVNKAIKFFEEKYLDRLVILDFFKTL